MDSSRYPNLHVSQHPLVAHKLALLRDKATEPKKFRELVRELSWLLGYEAMADLTTQPITVETPLESMAGAELEPKVGLIPVLRAGLGMVDAAQAFIPESQIGFVGVARDEETHEPTPYMASLPESLDGRPVFVLDPMLATGGSMVYTIELLTARGAADVTAVCVLAAPEGIARLRDSGLPLRLVTASVDERLNDSAYIVPGLGDAGDRQFGAV